MASPEKFDSIWADLPWGPGEKPLEPSDELVVLPLPPENPENPQQPNVYENRESRDWS